MSNSLKLALLSLDIVHGDKNRNLDNFESCLSMLDTDVDLVVVPELFTTGFTSNAERLNELAEPNSGKTVRRVIELARQHNFAITGSFLARTATSIYNRGFIAEPSGETYFYDKRHLFSMSSESSLLSRGDAPIRPVRFRGWNIAVAVCYDLRFPAWCRNKAQKYDLLVVVANWPQSREYAWQHLLIARAIENQAYVVGVDRSGEDKFGVYDQMSFAADYCGKKLDTVRSHLSSCVEYVTLDHDSLDRWRHDFTAWRDADDFSFD